MKANLPQAAALLAAAALLGAPAARADMPSATSAQVAASTSLSAMDRLFVIKAAQGGNAEVSLGRLALSKSESVSVKSFAQKMIADHTANGAKLASVLASIGGPPAPKTLSAADAAARAKLMQLSDAAFDASYLKGQVAGHEKMEALMQKEASEGTNAALKSFAQTTLPAVQKHLSLAQKDMSAMPAGQ